MRRWLLPLVVLALALPAAGPAHAVVPPTDCDFIRVKGKRYNVKTHQLRCPTARSYARTYLEKRRLRGWTCRRYRNTAVVFRCKSGRRELFAIRR